MHSRTAREADDRDHAAVGQPEATACGPAQAGRAARPWSLPPEDHELQLQPSDRALGSDGPYIEPVSVQR